MPHQMTDSPVAACVSSKCHKVDVVENAGLFSLTRNQPASVPSAHKGETVIHTGFLNVGFDFGLKAQEQLRIPGPDDFSPRHGLFARRQENGVERVVAEDSLEIPRVVGRNDSLGDGAYFARFPAVRVAGIGTPSVGSRPDESESDK